MAARQESLDAKYINDHTALSATLDVTLNDFIVFKRLINALPTLSSASLLMRKHQLALVVLLILNKHLNGVAYLQVGVVTELVKWNNTVRLVANVNHYLALVD